MKALSLARVGLGALSTVVAAAAVLGTAEPSRALCAADQFDGRWENIDPNTRGITSINYISRCGDVQLCPVGYPCPDPPQTSIQVFGACHPSDCDWGESKVEFHRGSNWRYSIYDQGFAYKVVWYRLGRSDRLVVAEQVTYRDNRQDRTSWYYFDKVDN